MGAMTRHIRAADMGDEALFAAQDTVGTPFCFVVGKVRTGKTNKKAALASIFCHESGLQ
jgi:hypothetical protein